MSNKSSSKSPLSLIKSVCVSRYGVDVMECDWVAVEWSAEQIAQTHGVDVAAQAWRKVMSARWNKGRYATIPTFHHPLFQAFSALSKKAA